MINILNMSTNICKTNWLYLKSFASIQEIETLKKILKPVDLISIHTSVQRTQRGRASPCCATRSSRSWSAPAQHTGTPPSSSSPQSSSIPGWTPRRELPGACRVFWNPIAESIYSWTLKYKSIGVSMGTPQNLQSSVLQIVEEYQDGFDLVKQAL